MITKNQLVDSIARKLDLEKINVQERVTIFCFPKKNDENFRKKIFRG